MTDLDDNVMLHAKGLSKHFVLHNQGGAEIKVFEDLSLEVTAGECVILSGASGAGKSSLLRSLYANYKPQRGEVWIRHKDQWVDLLATEPWQVLEVRRDTLGYVSQFLRVIPRVTTMELVIEPLIARGESESDAREKAGKLLEKIRIPSNLWDLPPATFSGGEQQRVNLAMTFIQDYPILLLDEPTASLDKDNRQTVIELINDARSAGAAIVGIFHDAEVRAAVGTRSFDLETARNAA